VTFNHSFDNVVKKQFQYAACMQRSTGSSGRTPVGSAQVERGREGGREGGEVLRGLGRRGLGKGSCFRNRERWDLGGLISRLCFHFFLGFASRGRPISFPRSFSPVRDRR